MIDMRCRLPPEKVLKKSSTLPLVVSNRVASERGSMPGSGTKESSRNTTKAPRVNQRRFLRSVAFAKFARLRLEAICSAADAIRCSLSRWPSYRPWLRHCEERSDEAIQPASEAALDCFAPLAMTAGLEPQALRFLTLFFLAAALSAAETVSISSTEPPAASTAPPAPPAPPAA